MRAPIDICFKSLAQPVFVEADYFRFARHPPLNCGKDQEIFRQAPCALCGGSWKCAYCNRYPASNYIDVGKTFLWRMHHEQTVCEFIYVRPHWTVITAGNTVVLRKWTSVSLLTPNTFNLM